MFRRALAFSVFVCAAGAQQTIRIDGKGSGRTFEGIGAISAGASTRLLIDYPEPYRGQILDFLFKPNFGASLQHLKVEVGGEMNSTDGSEPTIARTREEMAHPDFNRGYEWWLMREAKKRNPRIYLDVLPWGAPGWIGGGRYYTRDMADYVVKFIQGAKTVHNLDIDYVGVWNENKHDAEWVKLLKRTLAAKRLSTRIVCCDELPHQNPWGLIDEMKNDPELNQAIDAVGVHYTEIDTKHVDHPVRVPQSVIDFGKPLWGSEDHPPRPVWRDPRENDWPRGSQLGKLYNENYIVRRYTKTEPWAVITSYYDVLRAPNSGLMFAATPWSGHYRVQTTIWTTAHTTQFARPGWAYIDSACGRLQGKGSFVTLKSPNGKDYSVIVETIDAAGPQTARFEVAGGLSRGTVHVWRSTERALFERLADLTPANGSFTVTLEPGAFYSLTTTTGQRKGVASPAADKPFPLPYTENFEHTALRHSPKYLSDQNGAFEVMACAGRPGRCLEQVITARPILWSGNWDPHSVLGDADWTDYQVSADVRLDGPGKVALLGRIDKTSYSWKGAEWPGAYTFVVDQDGRWLIENSGGEGAGTRLASGSAAFPAGRWHRLALRFKGANIDAYIDGAVVGRAKDGKRRAGLAAIGCGWHQAQFDNLRIER